MRSPIGMTVEHPEYGIGKISSFTTSIHNSKDITEITVLFNSIQDDCCYRTFPFNSKELIIKTCEELK